MKKRIKIALCGTLVLAAVVLSGNLARSFETANAQSLQSSQPSSRAELPRSGASAGYVVGAYNGSIAVYAGGQKSPQTVTDIPLDSLTDTDRRSVEAGIPVDSYEALLQLLEDFGS